MKENEEQIIGIDLGGTNVRAGLVSNNEISGVISSRIASAGSVDDVMQDIFRVTDQVMNDSVKAIGIGVPGVVDVDKGIVYDVQNIKSWKQVTLKDYMQDRYRVPVQVNNDANCFALGEKYFGKAQGSDSFIGLIVGTGLGAGVVINNKIFAGANCGAGEFGMVDYLDQNYEYYASGQYFKNVYRTNGEDLCKRCDAGDAEALKIYSEMGEHLGNAIKMILFTYDPQKIILGGSVRHAYKYFQEAMWDSINKFAFPKSLDGFTIEISELKNSAELGAAALYYDSLN